MVPAASATFAFRALALLATRQLDNFGLDSSRDGF
jgi:hypothetical protein